MAPLPTPVRAALGLAANAVEAARTLPDRVVELPVLAVSTALQISLRAQQRYTELALRGDELIGRLHAPPEEPPSWATFDDEAPAPATAAEPGDGPAEPTNAAEPSDDGASEPVDPVVAPADIPISTPAEQPPAPVKSAAKQPRARKKTAAATKTTANSTAKSSAAKPVRAPRQAKPSAFDRTEE